ncbi:MAG TPA: aminotransferase class V-fold PLP-dependent enzyme [Cellulomonas sp.]
MTGRVAPGVPVAPARHLDPATLLDQPPLTPAELVDLEALAARILRTTNDVLVLQAEAILTLEAVARSLAAPGRRALNIVSGPYGGVFGGWLQEGGADVTTLTVPFDQVVTPDQVAEVIDRVRPDVVAVVHAEAATGGTNPVAAIGALARQAGALTVVDAVAAVGAEPVETDAWDLDVVAIGPQKGLAGPAGVSAVSISERAWAAIDTNPGAPRRSSLSLLDQRDGWLRTDRTLIPGMPSWLESRAFAAAARRVLDEGLDAVQDRHRRSAAAAVAGARALGVEPWQEDPSGFAPVVTTLRALDVPIADAALGGILSRGNGPLRDRLLRVNHTGRAAALGPVLDAIDRLGALLGRDASTVASARTAATRSFGATQV